MTNVRSKDSKRRRVVSEFGAGSCVPEGGRRRCDVPSIFHRFPLLLPQQRLIEHTAPRSLSAISPTHHSLQPVHSHRSSNSATSGPVVTGSRIAAASTRALPARAAHFSCCTLRLRPGASAAPAPSNHITQLHTTRDLAPLTLRYVAPPDYIHLYILTSCLSLD